jgi:PP-loop superfamily ATP-utilizing enzyme
LFSFEKSRKANFSKESRITNQLANWEICSFLLTSKKVKQPQIKETKEMGNGNRCLVCRKLIKSMLLKTKINGPHCTRGGVSPRTKLITLPK